MRKYTQNLPKCSAKSPKGGEMRLKPVDSEMLRLAGYDAKSEVLEVVFISGERYRYKEVPRSEYERLMTAESIGQYMHRHIIGHYDYQRLDRIT
jgi:hypothetical protein